jgi:hypothetical protein
MTSARTGPKGAAVTRLRALLLRHRALAILMVAAALCLKALVPAGYMLEAGHKVLTVAVCMDSSGHTVTRDIVVPMKGSPAGDAARHAEAGKACAWSSLGMASLAGADALLLAAALAFILALGFAPATAPRPRRAVWLRPPLRGPPLTA